MTATRHPTPDTFPLDRSEATAAKRALQSALERIEKVRVDVFGSKANTLDHAQRDIGVAITLLRDADKIERSLDFIGRASDARELTCPGCDKPVMTRAKQYTTCPHCGKTFRVTVQQRMPRKPKREDQKSEIRGQKSATRHSTPATRTGGAA